MPAFYLARRIGIFFLIVWLAATLNFFLSRIAWENPFVQKVMLMAVLRGNLHAGTARVDSRWPSGRAVERD